MICLYKTCKMHKVLVAYLEYKIPGVDDTETCKLLRKVANVPRTIIWSGFKRTFTTVRGREELHARRQRLFEDYLHRLR